jgi:HD-GYP domain-containing protein (c-di-GMP phosphodiesterase class II)
MDARKILLEGLGIVPSDVIDIVHQHHEDCAGQGYPQQLSRARVHPRAKVVQLANLFCEYTIKQKMDSQRLQPSEALKKITSFGERIDSQALAALSGLVLESDRYLVLR